VNSICKLFVHPPLYKVHSMELLQLWETCFIRLTYAQMLYLNTF